MDPSDMQVKRVRKAGSQCSHISGLVENWFCSRTLMEYAAFGPHQPNGYLKTKAPIRFSKSWSDLLPSQFLQRNS